MTDDLVKRLREGACLHNQLEAYGLTTEAADRIKALERQLYAMTEYLEDTLEKPAMRDPMYELWVDICELEIEQSKMVMRGEKHD